MKHLQKTTTDPDTGEVICHCCGRVVDTQKEVMQTPQGADLREKLQVEHHNKTTNHMHNLGLHTELGPNKDFAGKTLSYDTKRMRLWNQRITASNNVERRLLNCLVRHHQIIAYLQIPKPIAETSIEILRKAIKKGETKGLFYAYLSAAAIHWAYKQRGLVLDIRGMLKKLSLRRSTFNRYFMDIGLDLQLNQTDQVKDQILTSIHKLANNLHLPNKIILMAGILLEIARKIIPTELAGKSPMGIASGILYVAAKRYCKNRKWSSIYMYDFFEAASCTEVTMRNNIKMLKPAIDKFSEIEDFKLKIESQKSTGGRASQLDNQESVGAHLNA